jgi:hypothetical protein
MIEPTRKILGGIINMKQYMGIDQYGQHCHGLEQPRQDLMNKLGCQHADKMYVDLKNGKTVHVGYVISNHWIRIFEVIPWTKER